jgi:hypothetical protein
MADYMMSFGLEAAAVRVPNLLGPETKAWVERVHERYAFFSYFVETPIFIENRLL